MRLFVAVDVDSATRDTASHLRTRLQRECPEIDHVLRWVDSKQLHLTLRFLGECTEATEVQRVLASSFTQPCFSLAWGIPDWLPPRGRPRVFYVPVAEGLEAMRALAEEVSSRLQALGVPPEDRPFAAHLTLARVRDRAAPAVVRRLQTSCGQDPFAPGLRVEINRVLLFESRLSPAGPRYDVLWQGSLR